METRRALQVDAFADEPFAGNAAGVVPDAADLTESQMQAIANELAVSETAFFRESDEADRRVRYFTPTTEVDLCGHATIASHAHLLEDGVIAPGTHSLETNVGVLEIEVTEDGTVWMTQDAPEVREVDLDYERIGDALGIDHAALEDVGADLPLAVASTGLPFLVVPVNFLEHVSAMDPDFGEIDAISEEVDATGVYAFSFDALGADSTLHGRMFAPAAGVPEDPVTGTASGATGAYLREVEAFDGEGVPDEMVFEQGHFVDRPGRVRVRVGEEVRVGGQAATALDGELRVPELDDGDDIIEA
ncbi:PhzF family phenazine biosynthesis protein [Halorussus limi]|uniref:PhzF family phenazine biosynthesis protein n=1 Tax=Halorussus limi TaxID=2938695 RepID=A0A8U0HQH7_9EURY|nr:PhzF family phenazine biosynthesis protein [Halorussus limi]UPV73003.1 PhzF family phenazine biosynthesis protein [Halorussus limi]